MWIMFPTTNINIRGLQTTSGTSTWHLCLLTLSPAFDIQARMCHFTRFLGNVGCLLTHWLGLSLRQMEWRYSVGIWQRSRWRAVWDSEQSRIVSSRDARHGRRIKNVLSACWAAHALPHGKSQFYTSIKWFRQIHIFKLMKSKRKLGGGVKSASCRFCATWKDIKEQSQSQFPGLIEACNQTMCSCCINSSWGASLLMCSV